MTDHVKFNWNKITDNIYLGTNICCQMHFDEDLMALGISADISLEKERLDHAEGVEYLLWLPTVDMTPPAMDKLFVGVKTMEELIAQGKKIYVHCKNGHGRAPTLVAAYLIYQDGLDVAGAYEFIRQQRPEIHPEESQIAQLTEFKKLIETKEE